jgi:hypothetical protein
MDVVRTHVMLDPSLLLERSVLETTLSEIPSLRDQAGVEFFLAESVMSTYFGPDASRALRDFFKAGTDFVDPEEVASRLTEVGVTVWKSPTWVRDEFATFYNALGEEVNSVMIQDILFEEWFFLTHESWLVSRIKTPFHALARAGELGIELLNPIVRKMLHEDSSYVVRTADRMRALAKWMAIGGPPVATMLNPIVGAVASGVAGGFLLVDPPE